MCLNNLKFFHIFLVFQSQKQTNGSRAWVHQDLNLDRVGIHNICVTDCGVSSSYMRCNSRFNSLLPCFCSGTKSSCLLRLDFHQYSHPQSWARASILLSQPVIARGHTEYTLAPNLCLISCSFRTIHPTSHTSLTGTCTIPGQCLNVNDDRDNLLEKTFNLAKMMILKS